MIPSSIAAVVAWPQDTGTGSLHQSRLSLNRLAFTCSRIPSKMPELWNWSGCDPGLSEVLYWISTATTRIFIRDGGNRLPAATLANVPMGIRAFSGVEASSSILSIVRIEGISATTCDPVNDIHRSELCRRKRFIMMMEYQSWYAC